MSKTILILVDGSGSMGHPVVGDRTRHDLCEDMLNRALAAHPHARVVSFASVPTELPGLEPGARLRLPPPGGSTALDRAIEHVAAGPKPDRLIVICDGEVDDPSATLAAIRKLAPITVDTLYVGDDGNRAAIGFLRTLSLLGGRPGSAITRSLAAPQDVADVIQGLLAGPSR